MTVIRLALEIQRKPNWPPRKKKLPSKSLAKLGLKLDHTVKSLLKDSEKLETVYIWRRIEINPYVFVSVVLI